jgi:hypothetical protein
MEIEISLQNSMLSFHFLSSNLEPPSVHGLNLFFFFSFTHRYGFFSKNKIVLQNVKSSFLHPKDSKETKKYYNVTERGNTEIINESIYFLVTWRRDARRPIGKLGLNQLLAV